MCYAIIRVKYRYDKSGETSIIDVEQPDMLEEIETLLQNNDEVMTYTIFQRERKCVRQIEWIKIEYVE